MTTLVIGDSLHASRSCFFDVKFLEELQGVE